MLRDLWHLVVTVAAAVVVVIIPAAAVAAGGRELLRGEGDAAEQLAGVLRAAGGVAALLGGNAVVQYRNQQLGIPLQTDNRELPKRHQQNPVCVPRNQFFVKKAADAGGNLSHRTMIAPLPDLGTEDHGIQHFHH